MKKVSLIIVGLILIVSTMQSQDLSKDIVYNVKIGGFEGELKKVKKNIKGDIYLKNYNPYVHEVSVDVSGKENSKLLFNFIKGLFTNFFGVKSLETKTSFAAMKQFSDKEKHEAYLTNLIIELRQNSFDCRKIDSILNSLMAPDNTFNYKGMVSKELKSLEDIAINVRRYLKPNMVNKCLSKVGKYKADSDLISINIVLEPRDESKKFGFPIDKISATKKLTVKRLITFSSGIMGSFNVQPDYYVANNNGIFRVTTEKKDEILPGLTSLANLVLNNNGSKYFSIGGGMTIEGIPHFLGGFSYRPKETNLFITLGYGIAFIKTLSDGLSTTIDYSTLPTLKTKKESQGNFWFGISYKL